MSIAMASKARVRPPSSTSQLVVARSGMSQRDGLFLSGVVCSVFVLQRIVQDKRRRRHKAPAARPASQETQVQVERTVDDFRGWTNDSAAIPLPDAEKHAVVLLEEELPLSVRELWDLIYDPHFISTFFEKKKNREAVLGSWQTTDAGLMRRASYITPVKKNALGPSEAYTQEEHRCSQRGDNGFLVQVRAFTPKVPYGGSFHVLLHWTAVRLSQRKTKLLVLGQIAFTKRCLVQSIIKRATHEGLRENYELYRRHLWEKINSTGERAGPSRERAGPSKVMADRMVSMATREAAEELVREGVFVPWWQIVGCLLYLMLFAGLCRLSWLQNGRVLSWSKAYFPITVLVPVLRA